MIPLAGFWDYLLMLITTVTAGAIGGIGFELMQTRLKNYTGTLETPHRVEGGPYVDIGAWANIFLGAITAVAILYIFPPETRIERHLSDRVEVSLSYDIVKLIASSLIVGSAGPSFLTSLQARVAVALTEKEMQTMKAEIDTHVKELEKGLKRDVEDTYSEARDKVQGVIDKLPQTVDVQLGQPAAGVSINGSSVNAFEAEPIQVGDHIRKQLEGTVENLHGVCKEAERALQERIKLRVSATKKSLNVASGIQQ